MSIENSDLSNFSNEKGFEFDKVIKILEVIATKKATYKKEIAGITGYDSKTVSKILHKLEQENYIERLNPSIKNSDRRILSRAQDMWVNNMKGIDQFQNAKWYGLNSDYGWILKVDSSKDSDPEYVNEYHLETKQDIKKSTRKFLSENLKLY